MTSSKLSKIELVKNDEQIDDLQINGEVIIQRKIGFRYGVDAVLLANFVRIKNKNSTLIDLGTGNGIIPMIISAKSDIEKIYGLEIQEDIADMAIRTVKLNNLEDRIKIINMDLRESINSFEKESFDLVTSNPPYMPVEKLEPENISQKIARTEITLNLEELFKTVNYLLKSKGKFFMIHRPSRLGEIFCKSKKYNLEPKRVVMVYPKLYKAPNIVLIEFMKDGREEIRFYPALYIHSENGGYTEDIKKIYRSKKLRDNFFDR